MEANPALVNVKEAGRFQPQRNRVQAFPTQSEERRGEREKERQRDREIERERMNIRRGFQTLPPSSWAHPQNLF